MSRGRYLLLAIFTLFFGYFSRKYSPPSSFLHLYAGDAIWAAMLYFGFRFLLPKRSLTFNVCLTLLFCYAIELSQLYQAPWLNALRQTFLGGLILGFGFLWSDLVMYFVGIMLAFLIDIYLNKRFSE